MPNMRARHDELTWQTKDGRLIKISDMDDKHIDNTIRMLENAGVLQYERYMLQQKQKRWGSHQQTDDELIVEVEGRMLAGGLSLGSVARYHALCNERDRRKNRTEEVQGPYGNLSDDEAKAG